MSLGITGLSKNRFKKLSYSRKKEAGIKNDDDDGDVEGLAHICDSSDLKLVQEK